VEVVRLVHGAAFLGVGPSIARLDVFRAGIPTSRKIRPAHWLLPLCGRICNSGEFADGGHNGTRIGNSEFHCGVCYRRRLSHRNLGLVSVDGPPDLGFLDVVETVRGHVVKWQALWKCSFGRPLGCWSLSALSVISPANG
jgi:hypothetical protein